jgi:hypothetical protein
MFPKLISCLTLAPPLWGPLSSRVVTVGSTLYGVELFNKAYYPEHYHMYEGKPI